MEIDIFMRPQVKQDEAKKENDSEIYERATR